ncbi:hypothetical protein [Acetobacter fallax]|nr:hypothetical protein [Acetobacter fallax]
MELVFGLGLGLVVVLVVILAVIEKLRHLEISQKHAELRERVDRIEMSVDDGIHSMQATISETQGVMREVQIMLSGIEKSGNDTREMVHTIVRGHIAKG